MCVKIDRKERIFIFTLIFAAMAAEDALKHLTSRKVGAAVRQREASSVKLKRPDEKDDEATMALRAGKCSRGALRARPAKPDRQQNWRGPAIATSSWYLYDEAEGDMCTQTHTSIQPVRVICVM